MPFPVRALLVLGFLVSPRLFAAEAALELSGAWVRALPPGQPVTAAYVSIRNTGSRDLVITGASVEGAGRVEIHTTREVDGLARMVQLSTLSLAAGETLSLSPGGTHLMLFELEEMPRVGESRRLCVSAGPEISACTAAEVRKSAAGGGHEHNH